MPAGGYRITYRDKQLQKFIKKFTKRGGKLKTILQAYGEEIERATDRRHLQGKNVDGTPFKEPSPAYKKRKSKNKNKVLIERLKLKNSLTWQLMPGNRSVQIGYGDEKAKYHMSSEPRSKMPLRNPLGVSNKNFKTLGDIAEDLLLK